MQLVSVGSQILNQTVVSNPQFIALLPDDMGDTLNSALDNAYLYGRDWIAKQVRRFIFGISRNNLFYNHPSFRHNTSVALSAYTTT